MPQVPFKVVHSIFIIIFAVYRDANDMLQEETNRLLC